LYLASKNLPALYIPSSTAGVTSPSTAAGSLALDNAGNLLGVVLSQLKREGAPVIVSGMYPGHLDMRTLVSPYAEPERGIAQALVHHYGLPMFSYGGTSDAKVVDQQAAAEAALSLLVETLAGGNIIHDLGYLESGLSYSFCQLAICNEIVDWIKALKRDFVVNDETLALDVIAKVGPDGGFLETEHTLKHFRERWYPGLFERESYDSWLSRGGKSLLERAKEKVDKVLAEHKPRVRPAEIEQRIDEIIRRAEETAAPFR
jgi:trimethylamine--corrinoid protein Co-methyltransferase